MNNTKRIAVIFTGNILDRKGAINATLERIKFLKKTNQFELDVFWLYEYGNFLGKKILHYPQKLNEEKLILDDIEINIIQLEYPFFYYLFASKIIRRPYSYEYRFLDNIAQRFAGYDLLSVHSRKCAILGKVVKKKYNIPFSITWHGSDIHTEPFQKRYFLISTRSVLESASINLFVSNQLLDKSFEIFDSASRAVLYNGVNKERFRKIPKCELEHIVKLLKIETNKKQVSFIGNLLPIKNIKSLPQIFRFVLVSYPNVQFHIIGDGILRNSFFNACLDFKDNIIFHGNQPSDIMPEIYNCMDLVVLPSLNEGLPLTAVESVACGTCFVGSNVGGISEVVGVENVVDHGPDFCRNMANLIIRHLQNPQTPTLPEKFDWDVTAYKEANIYKTILNE